MNDLGFIDKLLIWWRVKRMLSLESLAEVLSAEELAAMHSEMLVIAEALERMIAVLRAKVDGAGHDAPAAGKV